MKAQNNKEIVRKYWIFSGHLATCVAIGVLVFFCYRKASLVEIDKIMDKTKEYDHIYTQQINLVNKIDSLFHYATLFNTKFNDDVLQKMATDRKQEIMRDMANMNSKDIRLCQKLMGEMNSFLSIKDSIRTLRDEEGFLREQLKKCIDDNKATTRKITIGGIVVPTNNKP